MDDLLARIQACCTPPSSSSSSQVSCTPCGFALIGNLSGSSNEFNGSVMMFGHVNTLNPLTIIQNSPPDTFEFPWPTLITPGECRFAYYSTGSWSPTLSVPAMMIIWDNGCWNLYRSYEVRDGRGVGKIAVTSPMAYSLDLPLGPMTFHTLTNGTLTLSVQTQVCSGQHSSSSSHHTPSSSSAPENCEFFNIVANVSGSDPVITGHLSYDIYGRYNTFSPITTPNGTFPWPNDLIPGQTGYGAFVRADSGPITDAPSYELLYVDGCWRLYAVRNDAHGNSVLEVGVSAPMDHTEQPPLGILAMTYINGYNLQVEVLNN
jgi:hypothetical protein